MKTKRLKAQPIETEAEFIAVVNGAARLQAERNVIATRRDRLIQRIALRYDLLLGPLDSKISSEFARAEKYADAHRKDLQPKDRKSVELATATYGWRTGTKAVRLFSKLFDDGLVIRALKAFGFEAYVRTVEEIAKDKILADVKRVDFYGKEVDALPKMVKKPTDADPVELLVALSDLGLKITQTESFYIEPKAASGETLKPEAT